MIVDQILGHDKGKAAFSYEGVSITYGQLEHLIKLRGAYVSRISEILLLDHKNPIKFIVDFLATAHLRKRVIVGHFVSSFDEIKVKKVQDWDIALELASERSLIESTNSSFKFGILSSGTEGSPKVVWRENDEWEYAFLHQSRIFNIPTGNKLLVLDALTYSANLNSAIHTLWNGGEVCFTSLKNAKNWCLEIESKAIDSVFLVPSHWKLLHSNKRQHVTVKSCVSAGEKLGGETCKNILKLFPAATLTEYYGAAELGHISYQQNDEIISNPLSVGKAFPEVKLSIKNQKIHVQSPYIAKDFKETGTVNDLGYLENDRLVLLGRAGRMFNKRGLNIYAQELESVAQLHPKVSYAVLLSTRNRKLSLLYTLKNRHNELNKKELWNFLEEHLAKSKHPHFIQEVDAIPLTATGKIDYQELKRTYESKELSTTV